VRPLTKVNATATSGLPARTALTAKRYKIFPIRVKCRSIKQIKKQNFFFRGAENDVSVHTHSLYTSRRWVLWIKMSINRPPGPIISGGNMSVEMKRRFIKKTSQMRVTFSVMNWSSKPLAEINPVNRVTWLQSMNYSHLVRPKFKQLRCFDCCWFRDAGLLCKVSQWFVMCSNLTLISYSFSSVSTLYF
jgi:hypothetical protein